MPPIFESWNLAVDGLLCLLKLLAASTFGARPLAYHATPMSSSLIAVSTLLTSAWTPLPAPKNGALDRRAVLAGGLFGAASTVVSPLVCVCGARKPSLRSVADSWLMCAQAAMAKIEDTNPANNYYFVRAHFCHTISATLASAYQPSPPSLSLPISECRLLLPRLDSQPMAKYRYLPRILRAWIAADTLAPAALEVDDWEGMKIVFDRVDDATTALPLYTSAVEGSRSTKRKKKSDEQKAMMSKQKEYKLAVKDLGAAIEKKDKKKTKEALQTARDSLLVYRQMAKIDREDGGCIELPLGNAQEAGHAGAPLGYVVPAFRGGGISMDYALRDGEAMMKNGQITNDYREKYQGSQTAATGKGK